MASRRNVTFTQAHKNRIDALRKKHRDISDRIEQEQVSPSVADFYLRQLKKEKLMLKEQIEGLIPSNQKSAQA